MKKEKNYCSIYFLFMFLDRKWEEEISFAEWYELFLEFILFLIPSSMQF
jgi:hypothetical protein